MLGFNPIQPFATTCVFGNMCDVKSVTMVIRIKTTKMRIQMHFPKRTSSPTFLQCPYESGYPFSRTPCPLDVKPVASVPCHIANRVTGNGVGETGATSFQSLNVRQITNSSLWYLLVDQQWKRWYLETFFSVSWYEEAWNWSNFEVIYQSRQVHQVLVLKSAWCYRWISP